MLTMTFNDNNTTQVLAYCSTFLAELPVVLAQQIKISTCLTYTNNFISPMLSHPGPDKSRVLSILLSYSSSWISQAMAS